jgi:hypothetical protein
MAFTFAMSRHRENAFRGTEIDFSVVTEPRPSDVEMDDFNASSQIWYTKLW